MERRELVRSSCSVRWWVRSVSVVAVVVLEGVGAGR